MSSLGGFSEDSVSLSRAFEATSSLNVNFTGVTCEPTSTCNFTVPKGSPPSLSLPIVFKRTFEENHLLFLLTFLVK